MASSHTGSRIGHETSGLNEWKLKVLEKNNPSTRIQPSAVREDRPGDYPWLKAGPAPKAAGDQWLKQEDQYLVDATLLGESYSIISQTLSRHSLRRDEQSCRDRITDLSGWRAGGNVLPQMWSWSEAEVAKYHKRGHRLEKALTNGENEELILFKGRGYRGVDGSRFGDKLCTARLRRELREFELADSSQMRLTVQTMLRRRKERKQHRSEVKAKRAARTS